MKNTQKTKAFNLCNNTSIILKITKSNKNFLQNALKKMYVVDDMCLTEATMNPTNVKILNKVRFAFKTGFSWQTISFTQLKRYTVMPETFSLDFIDDLLTYTYRVKPSTIEEDTYWGSIIEECQQLLSTYCKHPVHITFDKLITTKKSFIETIKGIYLALQTIDTAYIPKTILRDLMNQWQVNDQVQVSVTSEFERLLTNSTVVTQSDNSKYSIRKYNVLHTQGYHLDKGFSLSRVNQIRVQGAASVGESINISEVKGCSSYVINKASYINDLAYLIKAEELGGEVDAIGSYSPKNTTLNLDLPKDKTTTNVSTLSLYLPERVEEVPHFKNILSFCQYTQDILSGLKIKTVYFRIDEC